MSEVIYCTDLAQERGFPGCCHSCHDDADLGYDDLWERYDKDDRVTHRLCCRVAQWVDGRVNGRVVANTTKDRDATRPSDA